MEFALLVGLGVAVGAAAAKVRTQGAVRSSFQETQVFQRKVARAVASTAACHVCGQHVAPERVKIIYGKPGTKSYHFVCDKLACILNYSEGASGTIQQTLPFH